MLLTKDQIDEFNTLAEPLIEFLNNTCYPHVQAIIEVDRASLFEGLCSAPINKYIKD